MTTEINFFAYCKSFTVKWFTYMSGPLSVPLAIVAYYTQNETAKIGLILTAIICAVFASYWVWRIERSTVIELSEKIKPRLKLSFVDDNNCVLITPLTAPSLNNTKIGDAYYIRIKIENEGEEPAQQVSAYLTNVQIMKNDKFENTSFRTPLKLGSTSLSITKGISQYVNVFFINSTDREIRVESPLNEYAGICREKGNYKFEIQVSENNASQSISLGIDWRGTNERPRVTVL